jgi:hypothetical protein
MAFISNTGQASFKTDLEAIFETLQEQRSALLNMAGEVQLAARLLAAEEARRLSASVGRDDARVGRYVQANDVILRRVAALEVERQIADIRVPPVTKTETLLQGRITDESNKATAQLQVTLIDESGAPVAGIAPVQTDDSGYYAFVLQPEQVQALGVNRKLSLQIGNDNAKLVPAASSPVVLTAGQVAISETRLQAGELDKLRLRTAFVDSTRVRPRPDIRPNVK